MFVYLYTLGSAADALKLAKVPATEFALLLKMANHVNGSKATHPPNGVAASNNPLMGFEATGNVCWPRLQPFSRETQNNSSARGGGDVGVMASRSGTLVKLFLPNGSASGLPLTSDLRKDFAVMC